MSRQAQTICPCSGWSRDVGSSIHQPPQWHGFLVGVCSLSLRFCQEPVPQGSGLQLCMAGVSNSLKYCNNLGTVIPAYHTCIRTYTHVYTHWRTHTRTLARTHLHNSFIIIYSSLRPFIWQGLEVGVRGHSRPSALSRVVVDSNR